MSLYRTDKYYVHTHIHIYINRRYIIHYSYIHVERVSGRAQESMSVEKFVPMEIIFFTPTVGLCFVHNMYSAGRGLPRL